MQRASLPPSGILMKSDKSVLTAEIVDLLTVFIDFPCGVFSECFCIFSNSLMIGSGRGGPGVGLSLKKGIFFFVHME